MILIVDYQAGNLKSLCNTLSRCGYEPIVSSDPKAILSAPLVILPGVGAFGDAMAALEQSGLDRVLKARHQSGKPILGICLGMQLFFESSNELGNTEGLGLLSGHIRRLNPSDACFKVPHMGWNTLELEHGKTLRGGDLTYLEPFVGTAVYFVHSYALEADEGAVTRLFAQHGGKVPAVVDNREAALSPESNASLKGRLIGFQFHPEKSGPKGAQLLQLAIETLLNNNTALQEVCP